jgi:hypothetical protein
MVWVVSNMPDVESIQKKAVPPYVAYTTLKNFLEKFKQGVPGRIGRDVMGTMSGAAQSQVTTALKHLGFISAQGLPSSQFKEYVKLEGEARKMALHRILEKAYPYIFGQGFDFGTATFSLLREAFEANTGATGGTLDRCMAFLKEAAADAGVSVSPFLGERKPRGTGPRSKARSSQPRHPLDGEHASAESSLPPARSPRHRSDRTGLHIAAEDSLLLWGLFERLPKPGAVWPKAQRDQWLQTLQNVFSLEYRDEE